MEFHDVEIQGAIWQFTDGGEFDGSVIGDGFNFTFDDAPNPAVGIAIWQQDVWVNRTTLIDIDYSAGDASILVVLPDGTVVDDVITDANPNDIRSGLDNLVDDGGILPITIVPTDADFII